MRQSIELSKYSLLAGVTTLLLILLTACASGSGKLDNIVQAGFNLTDGFTIRQIDVRPIEASSEEVEAWVTGVMDDTCERIGEVTEMREANVISLEFSTKASDNEGCGDDEIVEFIHIVVLDIEGLRNGTYFVTVGGVSDSFVLEASIFVR